MRKADISRILNTALMFILVFVTTASVRSAYALNCNLPDFDDPTEVEAPAPAQILCPMLRIVNAGILIGGIIFAVMIAYGAIKMSTSLGDPKGYEGAVRTWLYAIIGVFIVLGAFGIVRILDSVFGLGMGSWLGLGGTRGLFDRIELRINNLLNDLYIVR